jgi:hypothetical protein
VFVAEVPRCTRARKPTNQSAPNARQRACGAVEQLEGHAGPLSSRLRTTVHRWARPMLTFLALLALVVVILFLGRQLRRQRLIIANLRSKLRDTE